MKTGEQRHKAKIKSTITKCKETSVQRVAVIKTVIEL